MLAGAGNGRATVTVWRSWSPYGNVSKDIGAIGDLPGSNFISELRCGMLVGERTGVVVRIVGVGVGVEVGIRSYQSLYRNTQTTTIARFFHIYSIISFLYWPRIDS